MEARAGVEPAWTDLQSLGALGARIGYRRLSSCALRVPRAKRAKFGSILPIPTPYSLFLQASRPTPRRSTSSAPLAGFSSLHGKASASIAPISTSAVSTARMLPAPSSIAFVSANRSVGDTPSAPQCALAERRVVHADDVAERLILRLLRTGHESEQGLA